MRAVLPELVLSKILKTSFNSPICSSVKYSAIFPWLLATLKWKVLLIQQLFANRKLFSKHRREKVHEWHDNQTVSDDQT